MEALIQFPCVVTFIEKRDKEKNSVNTGGHSLNSVTQACKVDAHSAAREKLPPVTIIPPIESACTPGYQQQEREVVQQNAVIRAAEVAFDQHDIQRTNWLEESSMNRLSQALQYKQNLVQPQLPELLSCILTKLQTGTISALGKTTNN